MGGFLLVPIHLDALCIETDLSVVRAKCDFTLSIAIIPSLFVFIYLQKSSISS